MKLIIIIWIMLVGFSEKHCDMTQVRADFYTENTSSDRLEKRINFMEGFTCETVEPYLACAIMQRAEHSSWPFSQLSYFNEGKDRLETYISTHPNDIEARYIRLLTQEGAPSFLGYKGDISTDANYILEHVEASTSPEWYKEKMKESAKKSLNG